MSKAIGIVVKGYAELDGSRFLPALELVVPGGKWTCLLGHSGVGKTTLLRLLAGLEIAADFRGTVSATDGGPVASRIAYMAQEDLLFPWSSVLNNIQLGPRLRLQKLDRGRAGRLLERIGLAGHGAKLPHALSGGQRQRVALARTLMEDRPLILLDEPFSALDARTRSEMQDLAAELLRKKTVLQVTHDPLEAARLGQKILVMNSAGLAEVKAPPGKVPREVDDPETLATQGALHRMLLEDR